MHLGFFKSFIQFTKTAANFHEIGRKYIFTAPNRNIIKNRMQKKKIEQFSKNYRFLFLTLILHKLEVITSSINVKNTLIIGLQVLNVSI